MFFYIWEKGQFYSGHHSLMDDAGREESIRALYGFLYAKHVSRCHPSLSVFFLTRDGPNEPRSFHFSGGSTITHRTKRNKEITNKSKHLTLKTLEDEVKVRSGLAPSPPLLRTAAQTSTSPPGTRPLGVRHQEPSELEQRGLCIGITTWRLILTWSCRPEWTVVADEGGSGRPSTILDNI
jgi:hypothetical protein